MISFLFSSYLAAVGIIIYLYTGTVFFGVVIQGKNPLEMNVNIILKKIIFIFSFFRSVVEAHLIKTRKDSNRSKNFFFKKRESRDR
jgi:hypothetical protein